MWFAITETFSSIRDFMEAGGSVLWLIAILVFFMWAMIFERIWYFSHGHEFYVQDLSSKWNNRSDKTSLNTDYIMTFDSVDYNIVSIENPNYYDRYLKLVVEKDVAI